MSCGTEIPAQGPALLQETAAFDSHIGAVSPLSDDLMGAAVGGRSQVSLRDLGTSDVNLTLASSGVRSCFELDAFLPDCVYLSCQAIAALASAVASGRLVTNTDVLSIAHALAEDGYLCVICDHLYVQTARGIAVSREFDRDFPLTHRTVATPLVDYLALLVRRQRQQSRHSNFPGADGRPVQLHTIHSMGGGLERWVRDFCRSDQSRVNLVLKPLPSELESASLALYADLDDPAPLRIWQLATPLHGMPMHHLQYASVLREIIESYRVQGIIVSTLIGHSLDVLATGLPTLRICHDFHPVCPAICLYHGHVCTSCNQRELADCIDNNPLYLQFPGMTAHAWQTVREQYVRMMIKANIPLVAPTPSTLEHLVHIDPCLASLPAYVVPHGMAMQGMPSDIQADTGMRLRVVVLGRLQVHKGLNLLTEAVPGMTATVDLLLVGTGKEGARFEGMDHITVIQEYKSEELPALLASLHPDFGMLLSIWPETYSYTLSELWAIGLPVMATRLGSFADRIQDGVNGWLVDPYPEAIINKLAEIDANRGHLETVRGNAGSITNRPLNDMVSDYHRILPLPGKAGRCYPLLRPYMGPVSTIWGTPSVIDNDLTFSEYLWASQAYILRKLKHGNGFKGRSHGILTLAVKGGFTVLRGLNKIWMAVVCKISKKHPVSMNC